MAAHGNGAADDEDGGWVSKQSGGGPKGGGDAQGRCGTKGQEVGAAEPSTAVGGHGSGTWWAIARPLRIWRAMGRCSCHC